MQFEIGTPVFTMDGKKVGTLDRVVVEPGTDAPHLHWYLQICPRLTTLAGFEIGSGMRINPSIPEEDAGFLRETAGEPWRVA